MRPDIGRARIASPAYSTTWPTPPATPILPIAPRIMSLAVTPSGSEPMNWRQHRLRLALGERLRREHVLDLGRADAERERAERAVRRRVAVAADDRDPGLREAELGADDVHDPLAPAAGRVEPDAELLAVAPQRLELRRGELVRRPVVRRDVVVHRRERQFGPPHLPPRQAQALERLRRGHLVDEVQVDVEQRRLALGLVDEVRFPDAVEERLSHPRIVAIRRSARGASSAARKRGQGICNDSG